MGATPKKLSASRGASILGISKYKTAVETWIEIIDELNPGFCEKQGFSIPEKKDCWSDYEDDNLIPLRWGLAFEDAICDHVGITEDREKLFEKDFLTCHTDGTKNKIVHENKTTNPLTFRSSWGTPGTEFVPEDIQIQVQHQLMVTGLKSATVNVLVFPKFQKDFFADGWRIKKHGDYISLHNESNLMAMCEFKTWVKVLNTLGFFHQFHIKANKELQDEMFVLYSNFWHNHILKKTPPGAQKVSDLKWLIPAPVGEIEADERIRELWNEYTDIDQEIESSKKRMDEIKNTMAKFLSKQVPKESAEKGKIRIMGGPRCIATYSKSEKGNTTFRVNKIKKEV